LFIVLSLTLLQFTGA